MKKFFEEFKKFAIKGNMIDMAIGVIIGGAFTALVTAFTANIVNPLVALIPGVDGLENTLKVVLKEAVLGEDGAVVKDEVAIKFGAFISAMFLSKAVLTTTQTNTEGGLPADSIVYITLAGVLIAFAVLFMTVKLPKIQEESGDKKPEKLIDFSVLRRSHLRWGVIAQFFYNGGQTAINSLFLVYCCTYVGLPETTATTFFGFYMLAFLVGRWIGTLLMGRFRPPHMLTVYAIVNVLLCAVIMIFGGMVGIYAMLGVSFFMSIMYPTQFSLALTGLGDKTKSGSAFLVMAIVGNACLPQLTAYVMHTHAAVYQVAYIIPLICFAFCAYYGWRGHVVKD